MVSAVNLTVTVTRNVNCSPTAYRSLCVAVDQKTAQEGGVAAVALALGLGRLKTTRLLLGQAASKRRP